MTTEVLFKAGDDGFGGGSGDRRHDGHGDDHMDVPRPARPVAASIGLWCFIGVATSLFSLFLVAFALRMDAPDWQQIGLPWQTGLSTVLLVAASAAMQVASARARAGRVDTARTLLALGGVVTIAFVASQLYAWQALIAMRVALASNPAGSFFYLLTAMHGLHVLGGLAGLAVAWRAPRGGLPEIWRIRLCARYWHFLLAVWVVLLAALGWLTPEIVRAICGTS